MAKNLEDLTITDPNIQNQFDDGSIEIDITSIQTEKDISNKENDIKKTYDTKARTSLSHFDTVLERKKAEYERFVEMAKAEDAENRALIEDGLEDPETIEEILYRNEDIEKLKNGTYDAKEVIAENGEVLDEVERELENEIKREVVEIKNPPRRINIRQEEIVTAEENPVNVISDPEDEIEDDVVEEETIEIDNTYIEEKEDEAVVADDKEESIEEPVEAAVVTPKVNAEDKQHINMIKVIKTVVEEFKAPENFNIDPDDMDDLNDDDLSDLADEGFKNLQSEINERLNSKTQRSNKGFSVSNKSISVGIALNRTKKESSSNVFNWVAYFSKRPIQLSALTSPELFMLEQYNTTSQITTQQAQILYKHDMNPFKGSFESWCKTICTNDIDHYFAAIYGANYNGANYIPYQCEDTKCGHMQLSENINIMDMCKFKDDKIKSEFMKLINTPQTKENMTEVSTEIIRVSDDIAVGYQTPSLYNTLFETANLDESYREKYRSIIYVINYIDNLYYVDYETSEYIPIEFKTYTDSTKNVKSKIASYSKLIGELTPDEHSVFMSYINALNKDIDAVTYSIPATKCNKCGKNIEESPIMAKDALFTRRQLGVIATTSIDS